MARILRTGRFCLLAAASAVLLGGFVNGAQPGAALTTGVSAQVQSAAKAPPVIPLPPPGDFVQVVDNAYLPFLVGSQWKYGGTTAKGQRERITVDVLERTKLIAGIHATVVRDVAQLDGVLREATYDWYAQDRKGNVWYLGEDTKLYDRRGNVISTEGSWETDVDGAQAGIVMWAHPEVSKPYRQEYYRGHAEDQAKVLTMSTQAATVAGHYSHVRMTEDTTALEPTTVELKFYASGVGVVQEFDLSSEFGRTELLSFHGPARG